jgi:uncharacterized protein YbjT (DUF2867 family)
MNIAVFGGTGFVGRALITKLINAGHRVTLITRDRERAMRLALMPGVTVETADVSTGVGLTECVLGHDAVVNLVGILHERRTGDFLRIHRDLTQRIMDACGTAGVPRYLHMSALGADVAGPSIYQRSKGEAEALVRASKLSWTIFAPSVIFGRDDSFLNMFQNILKVLPPFLPLLMPRAGAQFQPVWVDDVARAMVAALSRADTVGQRYELGGPKTYTLRALLQHVGARMGRAPVVLSTPGPFAMLQAFALEVIPGGPLMSRDNLRSMSVDNVTTAPWPAFALPAPVALESVTPGYLGTVADPYAAYRQT